MSGGLNRLAIAATNRGGYRYKQVRDAGVDRWMCFVFDKLNMLLANWAVWFRAELPIYGHSLHDIRGLCITPS